MAKPTVVALLANGTISTTGNGSSVPFGSPTPVTCNEAIAILNCTAVGVGGGQTILIAGSSDGGTTWTTLGTFGVSTIASGTVGVRTGISTINLTGGIPPLLRYSNTAGGSSSITASIIVVGLEPNDSVEATTMPGVGGYAKSLRFLVQPTSVQHGAHSISPTVTVQVVDYLGNVCASDSGTSVTLTIVPAAGSASGVLTGTIPATASSGVASFADLQISLAGQYTLLATATGVTSATSNSFPVTT
jgi:hypothetical protein